jgi:hypothetical protein
LNNEEIIGLISDGTNVHIGTDKSIFTCYGSGPTTFSVPSQAFAQTGILSNDLWTVIYTEGVPSGFVWLTQDFKVVHSDFVTYREIGMGIYPITKLIDPTRLAQCKVLSLTQGPYNIVFFQLYLTGITQPVFLLWETRLQKWYRWTINNAITTGLTGAGCVYQYPAYTTGAGTPGAKYLFLPWWNSSGSNNEKTYYFDPNAALTGWDLGSTFIPWNVKTAWQDFQDATSIKTINEIEFTGDLAPLTVTLWGATSQPQFDAGGILLKTGPSVKGPISALDTNKFYCAGAATSHKYYSLQFTSIAPALSEFVLPGAIPNALTSFSLEHYPMARI